MNQLKQVEALLSVKFNKCHNSHGEFYRVKFLKCSLFFYPASYSSVLFNNALVVAFREKDAKPSRCIYWTSLNRLENKKIELMEVIAFADTTRCHLDLTGRHSWKSTVSNSGGTKKPTVYSLSGSNTTASSKNI